MENLKDPLYYIPTYFKVLTKADSETGLSSLAPMKLWPSQEYYIANRTHHDICLKNRQTGFSTGVLAVNTHMLFTQPYQRQAIVTHDEETSIFLFQTVQRFLKNLPPDKRHKTDWKSGRRMRFPDLDSYIYVESANSESIGIGHTLSTAHLSEVAKWPPRNAEQLFADISQTVPAGGYITMESTPKGRGGLFYRLYQAAKKEDVNYKCFFFPWWWDVTCVRPVTGKMEYTAEEKQLTEHFELRPEQIAFRREKIAELGDLAFQEYPENDIDCWLSSDISVFDGVAIRRYLQQIIPGREDGRWTIWKDAIGGEKYVIGVDVAAGKEKGDWSVAAVLNVKRNEYVARLRAKIPPDFFAQELLNGAYRYNNAEVGVERAGHGHSVLRVLLDNDYPNIYHHQDYDKIAGLTLGEPGWKTSRTTKPIMVDTMAASLRAGDLISWSENLMVEASSYVWEGQNATKTPGADDDELDAVMIALQLRENAPIIDQLRRRPVRYASINL